MSTYTITNKTGLTSKGRTGGYLPEAVLAGVGGGRSSGRGCREAEDAAARRGVETARTGRTATGSRGMSPASRRGGQRPRCEDGEAGGGGAGGHERWRSAGACGPQRFRLPRRALYPQADAAEILGPLQ